MTHLIRVPGLKSSYFFVREQLNFVIVLPSTVLKSFDINLTSNTLLEMRECVNVVYGDNNTEQTVEID